jgi:hypothetical protein
MSRCRLVDVIVEAVRALISIAASGNITAVQFHFVAESRVSLF